MPGLVAPEAFPIRDPRDVKQVSGRIVNPPRMIEMGGLDAQNKWNKEYNTSNQSPQQNMAPVEKATNVRGAHDASGSNED